MSSINPIMHSQSQAVQPQQKTSNNFQKHLEQPSRVDKAIKSIHRDEKQLNSMIRRAERGADFDNQELIRMQALSYRYSQKVDLASKVVNTATSGLKQILNTQV